MRHVPGAVQRLAHRLEQYHARGGEQVLPRMPITGFRVQRVFRGLLWEARYCSFDSSATLHCSRRNRGPQRNRGPGVRPATARLPAHPHVSGRGGRTSGREPGQGLHRLGYASFRWRASWQKHRWPAWLARRAADLRTRALLPCRVGHSPWRPRRPDVWSGSLRGECCK